VPLLIYIFEQFDTGFCLGQILLPETLALLLYDDQLEQNQDLQKEDDVMLGYLH
jgi:hypothetical protein